MEIQQDKIFQIQDATFYLPNYPTDCISSCIVGGNNYWDYSALLMIDKYLPDNAVVLDIGANIGSHTIYWALRRKAKKVYSFEPFLETYNILEKNIELNNLSNVVEIYNYGLSDEPCVTRVDKYAKCNIGGTSFVKDNTGTYVFRPLDSMKITDKIDLIKIDVEGHEIETLNGAINVIKNNKPVIVIESFTHKKQVDAFLLPLGYEQVETIRANEDYIYKYVGENV